MKKYLLLFLIPITVFAISVSRISVRDTVVIGKKTSTANKAYCVEYGNGTLRCIRYNTTSSEWEFSNDGSSFDAIGSGGGFTSPMTTDGDLITQDGSVPARIGVGEDFSNLRSDGSDPFWFSNWFVSAYVASGSSDAALSSVSAAFQEITLGTLELSVETSKGSLPAEIPCSGTNPSTGLTCGAGLESVGVVFEPSYIPTTVEVCATFTNFKYLENRTSVINNYFKIVETPNDAQTILQDPGSVAIMSNQGNSDSVTVMQHVKLCGNFLITTSGKKTFMLFNKTDITGTIDGNSLLVNNSFIGNRRVMFLARPLR